MDLSVDSILFIAVKDSYEIIEPIYKTKKHLSYYLMLLIIIEKNK